MADCQTCLYNPVCELWREAECQDACSVLTGGLRDCPIHKSAADVVEERHGEWVAVEPEGWRANWYNDTPHFRCSVCRCDALVVKSSSREQGGNVTSRKYIRTSFCPNCGAKMDGKGE